jgi:hypothetical protein
MGKGILVAASKEAAAPFVLYPPGYDFSKE